MATHIRNRWAFHAHPVYRKLHRVLSKYVRYSLTHQVRDGIAQDIRVHVDLRGPPDPINVDLYI